MTYSNPDNTISDFYNKNAPNYYNNRVLSGGSLFNEFIEIPAVLSLIKSDIKDSNILDIGCGLGLYSKIFSERGAKVTSIDSSIEMINYAKIVCKDLDINFVNVNFEAFQCPELLYFDIIIGGFMLSYFQDIESVFIKIAKILSKKGQCIFSMLHPLRLSSKRDSNGHYYVDNYFDNDSLYESDFLDKNDLLYLKKWSISDISKAASNSGLLIEIILEPLPINPPSHFDRTKIEYLYKCPSVIIFKFIRKE